MAQDLLQMLLSQKQPMGMNMQQAGTQSMQAMPFPMNILPNLLRMAGVASTTQPGKEGEGQRVAGEMATQLNPMQEVVQKEVLKGLKTITKDAMTQTDNPMGMAQHIMQQSGIPMGAGSGASGAPPAQQDQNVMGQPGEQQLTQAMAGQPQQAMAQQSNGIMDYLKNILRSTGEGIIGQENLLARSQRQQIEQKMRGEEPLQKGEREKLGAETAIDYDKMQFEYDLKLRNELSKTKDTDAAAINVAANSFNQLYDKWDSIGMKGPVRGRIGGALGSVGIGTGGRAEFESLANQFVFDVGNVLGQKGRAFTEKEQELVRKKVIQGFLHAKGSDFAGRMEAIRSRINTLAGEEILPARGKGQQTQPGTKSVTQGKTSTGTPWKVVGE